MNTKADLSSITGGWGYMGRKLDGPRYWLINDLIRKLIISVNERKIHNEKRN